MHALTPTGMSREHYPVFAVNTRTKAAHIMFFLVIRLSVRAILAVKRHLCWRQQATVDTRTLFTDLHYPYCFVDTIKHS